MDYIFLQTGDGFEWEDMKIILSEELVIEKSKKYPKLRFEKFINKNNEYIPSYSFYKNGILVSV